MHAFTPRNSLMRAVALLGTALFASVALAKLPPLSDEAKAKAADAAAKTAWSDKVGGFQLCRAMDRVAETYRKTSAATGKAAPAAVETPACADPGPFVAPVVAAPVAAPASAPPLEAAGAHSPTTPAVAPPSGKATAAEQQGTPKK